MMSIVSCLHSRWPQASTQNNKLRFLLHTNFWCKHKNRDLEYLPYNKVKLVSLSTMFCFALGTHVAAHICIVLLHTAVTVMHVNVGSVNLSPIFTAGIIPYTKHFNDIIVCYVGQVVGTGDHCG